jgi:hypothetical protein
MSEFMKYSRPDGCKAAVVASWDFRSGRFLEDDVHELEAFIVCGQRQITRHGTFKSEILDTNHQHNIDRVVFKVGGQVTEVLGAMCLGCPFNEVTN